MRSDPPTPPGAPVLGNTHQYTRDPFRFLTTLRDAYGDLAMPRIGRGDVYVVFDPATIERILVTDDDLYRKPDFQQNMLGPLVGQGLLTSEGELWRRQRERIQPAFFGERLAEYAQTVTSVTAAVTDDWADGKVVDVERDMTELTLRVIARTLFSTDIDERRLDRLHNAMNTVSEQFELDPFGAVAPTWLPTPGDREYRAAVRHLEGLIDEFIDSHRRQADPPDDLVTMLLTAQSEAPAEVTDEQIRDEVMTMLLAGHDTTALTLTYAWHLLSEHPTKRARLRTEVREVLGDDSPTFADLGALEYTDWVVSESMRLYPPVYAIWRTPTEPVTLAGYDIPADAVVMLPQWAVHRDERWFTRPTRFRPERWAGPDHPDYAYFPFGGGSRVCVGNRFAMMEAKLVLASVVSEWTLDTDPSGTLELQASITARPRNGLDGTVTRR
ncbi:MAG: cytochrome P450 [Halobacteriaceae archaeon]